MALKASDFLRVAAISSTAILVLLLLQVGLEIGAPDIAIAVAGGVIVTSLMRPILLRSQRVSSRFWSNLLFLAPVFLLLTAVLGADIYLLHPAKLLDRSLTQDLVTNLGLVIWLSWLNSRMVSLERSPLNDSKESAPKS